MNASRVGIAHRINNSEELSSAYSALFGALPDSSDWPDEAKPFTTTDEQDPLTEAEEQQQIAWQSMSLVEQNEATKVLVNIAKSTAAFVGTLRAPTTSFDDFLTLFQEAPETALNELSESQRLGLFLFTDTARCHLCHSGPGLTDLEFHNIGLPPTSESDELDLGRYSGIDALRANPFNAAGEWSDDPEVRAVRMIVSANHRTAWAFKTPTLRGLATTIHKTVEDLDCSVPSTLEASLIGHREEVWCPHWDGKNWKDCSLSCSSFQETEGLLSSTNVIG